MKSRREILASFKDLVDDANRLVSGNKSYLLQANIAASNALCLDVLLDIRELLLEMQAEK